MSQALGFDGVLAQLQAWLGQDVDVHIEARLGPTSGLAWLNGCLTAGEQLYEPADDHLYIFRVGDSAQFAIQRSFFEDATITDETLELIDESVIITVTRQAL